VKTEVEIEALLTKARRSASSGDIAAADASIQRALEIDSNNLMVHCQAARLYATVAHDPTRAREHALLAREEAARIAREMDSILGTGSATGQKVPASRHIGGIIGPY
jgi:Tfp pilus assembly protein PilF